MKFLVLGAGQQGELVAEIASRITGMECVGFLDSDPSLRGKQVHGIPVIGDDDFIKNYSSGEIDGAIPIMGDLKKRLLLIKKIQDQHLQIPTLIDPSVVAASNVVYGEGICISFSTTILTSVEIGDHSFIGTGVNILHNTKIGANCMIGGGTTIGASVTLGSNVYIGVGATIASGAKTIGNNVKIAAGTVVLEDVLDNSFILGNPGRVIGRNN